MAHVLIIDDDADVTHLLATHLSDEGHSVTVSHDCKDGMLQLMRNPPDLIMLDVFLPDATGYQMCNRIRKNDATVTTPIIMMTGAARFPNQQMYGRQRGANEYIFKPFDIVEVGELVQKYLPVGAPPRRVEPVQAIENPVEPREDPIEDNLAALNAFLKRTMKDPDAEESTNGDANGGIELNFIPQIPEPVEPLSTFGHIAVETAPTPGPSFSNGNGNGNGHHFEAFPKPPVYVAPEPIAAPLAAASSPADGFSAPNLGSKERFTDFGLEIFALATRLCSTHAEKYLADQLMRTGLSVGAKLHLAQSSASSREFAIHLSAALQDLREAGYWLMLTRKTGLLEKLSKGDLEKSCQSLTTVLVDYEKKR